MTAAARALGVALPAPPPPPVVPVWPEHARAVRAWLALQTQWDIGPDNLPTGLRYHAVPEVLRAGGLAGLPPRPLRALWEQLRTMEAAVLDHYELQRQAQAGRG